MSTIAERAREEAERAEAEQPDEAEQTETADEEDAEAEEAEPPATPEPAAMTEKQVEAAFKKAGKAAETYAAKVQEALGPLFERFVPSPLDDLPGFVQVDPQGQVAPEVKAATLAFLGQEPEPEYRQNADTQTCRRCDGWGQLRSGSKVATHRIKPCPECDGTGLIPPPAQSAAQQAAVTVAAINGAQVQAPPEPSGPEAALAKQLRDAGYTVLDPIVMP